MSGIDEQQYFAVVKERDEALKALELAEDTFAALQAILDAHTGS